MLNILGEASGARGKQASEALMARAMQTPGTAVHWYGKEVQTKRKLGHITIVADDNATAHQRLRAIDSAAADAMTTASSSYQEATAAASSQGLDESSGESLPTNSAAAKAICSTCSSC